MSSLFQYTNAIRWKLTAQLWHSSWLLVFENRSRPSRRSWNNADTESVSRQFLRASDQTGDPKVPVEP